MSSKTKSQIFHFDLYGKRDEKYNFLKNNSINGIDWNKLDQQEPYNFFVPKDFKSKEKYKSGFKVDDLFQVNNSGVSTDRDALFLDSNQENLSERIKILLSGNFDTKFIENFNVKNSSGYPLLKRILNKKFNNELIIDYHYRPFDVVKIYFDNTIISRPAKVVSKHLNKKNIYLIVPRQVNSNFHHIFISRLICDSNITSSARLFGAGKLFPLYLYPDTSGQQSIYTGAEALEAPAERTPNLNPEIVNQIAAGLGLTFTNEKPVILNEAKRSEGSDFEREMLRSAQHDKEVFAPIDILDYIYAVLHAPSYRKKYKEFLKIDFPRVPYPKDKDVFWQLVALGGELRQIHLLESPVVEKFITQYPVDGDNVVGKVSFVTSPCPSKGGELPLGAPSKGGEQFVAAPSKGGEFPLGTPSKEGESHIAAPSRGGESHIASPSKEGADESADSFSKEGIPEKRVPGFHTANPYTYKYVKEIRQELKRNPTPAEKNMWEYLRNKKTGHKIRRQHVIHDFIPDFVCLRKRTIIEIDGKIHLQQKEYDDFRTEILNDMGYDVIRFTNEEVFASPEKVTAEIKKHLDSKPDYVIDKTVDDKADSTSSPEWAGKTSSPLGRPGGVNPPTACGRVYINDTQYFANVPEVAWNFYIGGYQPAQKWLKDRKGRQLEFEDIRHYQKIIVALTETERIMGEVDKIKQQ